MPSIKKILWATDNSASSNDALHFAIQLAEQMGSELHAVQAVGLSPDTISTDFVHSHLPGADSPLDEQQLIDTTRTTLLRLLAEHVPQHVSSKLHVELGKPDDVILRIVNEEQIDIIVMSTHGRTGLDHLLLGSVAESVIQKSPVPVLVTPKSEKPKQPS